MLVCVAWRRLVSEPKPRNHSTPFLVFFLFFLYCKYTFCLFIYLLLVTNIYFFVFKDNLSFLFFLPFGEHLFLLLATRWPFTLTTAGRWSGTDVAVNRQTSAGSSGGDQPSGLTAPSPLVHGGDGCPSLNLTLPLTYHKTTCKQHDTDLRSEDRKHLREVVSSAHVTILIASGQIAIFILMFTH